MRGWVEVGRAVAVRPTLWPTAIRAARTLAPPGWWRSRPFLPLPDRQYLSFRMVTAYGGEGDARVDPHDVITWLTWLRSFPR